MPVALPSYLVPRNSGTWYLLEDRFLRGGYRVCATLTERDSINSSCLKAGMLVYVVETGLTYRLDVGLTSWTVEGTSSSTSTFLMTQDTASNQWVLVHNRGSVDFVWSCWDSQGRAIIPDEVIAVGPNQVRIMFTDATAGRALLVFA